MKFYDKLLERTKLRHGALQIDSVERSGQQHVHAAKFLAVLVAIAVRLEVRFESGFAPRFSPQAHEDQIGRDTVQPCGEGGLAATRLDFAQHHRERFLSQILRFSGVSKHSHAKRVYARAMGPVDKLKGSRISWLRQSYGFFLRQDVGSPRIAIRNLVGLWASRPFYYTQAAHCSSP